METKFLSVISESKLKQILQESAENSGISLLLHDKSGELIMQYPDELQQTLDGEKIFTQIKDEGKICSFEKMSPDLNLFSEAILRDDQILAILTAIFSRDEECIKNIVHLTVRRLEDLIAFNEELESLSVEIIHNYDELNLLYTYSAMLADINDIEQASSKVIANAIDMIKADYGAVLLAETDKKELYFTHVHGKPKLRTPIKFGQDICGLVAAERKPVLVENPAHLPVSGDEQLLFAPPLIACPMIVNEKLIGVIILARESTSKTFTTIELKLLEAIASQAAVAFTNVQLLNDLIEKNQQLQETLKHLQLAQEQLIESQRLSAMGQLVASVAHDINNPLAGIMGYSELLLMDNEIDDKLREKLEIIHLSAKQAADIVGHLKTFAKKSVSEQQLVNINHLIQEILQMMKKTFAAKNIQITTNLASHLPETMADSGQIQQVLMNLLMNAMEAVNGAGSIEIKTEMVDDQVLNQNRIRFSISDDGCGIPKEIQAHIFEPFFTTKSEVKGTGLGLSICHGIVAAHQGSIYFDTEFGAGTTFLVELPIVSQDINPASNDCEVQKSCIDKITAKQILVVDDDPLVQSVLKDILISQGGLVDVASNGEEALSKLEQKQYDLYLFDIIMPEMDGIELYNRIGSIFPDLALKDKVVFVTGDTIREEIELFFEKNNLNYITKPFSPAVLCDRLNELL